MDGEILRVHRRGLQRFTTKLGRSCNRAVDRGSAEEVTEGRPESDSRSTVGLYKISRLGLILTILYLVRFSPRLLSKRVISDVILESHPPHGR